VNDSTASLKDQILALRSQNFSYSQIQDTLGCSKGTISYHLGIDQKDKTKQRRKKYRTNNPGEVKVQGFRNKPPKTRAPEREAAKDGRVRHSYYKVKNFHRRQQNGDCKGSVQKTFTFEDVVSKLNGKYVCYLSGRPIDLNDHKSYVFDHIIPVVRGGPNTLDNLGVTCPEANQAKWDMLNEELFRLCSDILTHQGYTILPPPSQSLLGSGREN
jgi:5-methylcytosine-specific restriction endonuclease McrA